MAHSSPAHTSHRPWPLPERPWRWAQTWSHLLFAHWQVPAEKLGPLIPRGIDLQEFDGSAWVGVVPFLLDVRPRFFPAVPGLSRFPEINVRTYVEADGKPGVWFFSLDASSAIAVWAARRFFHLPYFRAQMTLEATEAGTSFRSRRDEGRQSPEFVAGYGPVSTPNQPGAGTLEAWLTERYCLYAADANGLYRADVHHRPWPLQRAEAEIDVNTMLNPIGLTPSEAPLLHYARRLDVVIWGLRDLEA